MSRPDDERRDCLKPHLWLIRVIGVIVPRHLRADWRQEWEAELRHRERLLAEWDRLDWRNKLELLRRSLSAFWDALWLQPERWEDELIQDLRFGARMLTKNPGFTLIAALTLALGVGANTAVFSLLDASLFRALPVKDPRQLVFVQRVFSGARIRNDFPTSAFERLRELNHSFSGMAAYQSAPISGTVADQAEMLRGDFVSSDYFDVLGIGAAVGRTFTAEDDRPGSLPVAVISFGYWKRRFAQDRAAINKVILLGKVPVNVVGVTPPGFSGLTVAGKPPDVFLPMSLRSQLALKDLDRFAIGRAEDLHRIVARLKPGVGSEQARAELDSAYQHFLAQAAGADQHGNHSEKIGLKPGFRGDEELSQDVALELRILASVVGIVLLIASVNVAGLLLARGAGRASEIAVRLAVGASRFRLVRQLLTESVLLAALGGALGLLLAKWGARAFGVALSHGLNTPNTEYSPDTRALAFTAAVSLLTGVFFGLTPALAATRIDLNTILKGSEGGAKSRYVLGKSLVVAQVALSLALLIGAGLMIRSLRQLYGVDTGFERDKVLTLMAYPALLGYEREREVNLDRELLDRINALPGVQSASLALFQIYRGAGFIGPRYFETEGIRLVAGREFSTADLQSAAKVAVVSESMARKFFPDENPIGQHFGFELGGGLNIQPKTGDIQIVGVARDIRPDLWRQEWIGGFYLPFNQSPPRALGQVQFLVRAAGDPNNLIPSIRRAAQSVEKDLPLVNVKTQAEEMNEKYLGGTRSLTTLLGLFSALALALAGVGLYGTMSYTVGRRTKEIGIRTALGAQSKDIFRMALRETLLLAAIGVLIGLPLAMAARRLIASMLFGVKATDPITIAIAILVMLATAVLAGYLPARRATKVDPMGALRRE
jgi:predicted permease